MPCSGSSLTGPWSRPDSTYCSATLVGSSTNPPTSPSTLAARPGRLRCCRSSQPTSRPRRSCRFDGSRYVVVFGVSGAMLSATHQQVNPWSVIVRTTLEYPPPLKYTRPSRERSRSLVLPTLPKPAQHRMRHNFAFCVDEVHTVRQGTPPRANEAFLEGRASSKYAARFLF